MRKAEGMKCLKDLNVNNPEQARFVGCSSG